MPGGISVTLQGLEDKLECELENISGSHSIGDEMRIIKHSNLSIFIAFLFSIFFTSTALAHGDEPRIEISSESLNPGSVLDIRGVDFELDEEINLTLVGPQNQISLGSAIADAEGVFLLTITLPVDLVEGEYVVHGTTDDHVLDSPPITVWGSANLGGGEDGLRSEDDGLLAPMPTFAPGVVPNDALSQPTPQTSQFENRLPVKAEGATTLTIVMILLGIGILVVLGARMMLKKSV